MKRCLVIGGASDIGSQIVKTIDGYEVSWTYCNTDRQDNPGEGRRCDITKKPELKQLFETVAPIDLIVTAAFPYLESDHFDFQGYKDAEAFLSAHVYIMTEGASQMKRGGRIINLLGQCVERGLPGAPFYSASFVFI